MKDLNNFWVKRKVDHINLATEIETEQHNPGLGDVKLIHCALPGLDFQDINLSTNFMSKRLEFPLIINALTGGAEELTPLNKILARVAAKSGIAMAVGSQSIALKNEKLIKTFRVVRENNKDGVVLANISAGASLADAIRAIEMIEADGLQIHLNVPQELVMQEGDRNFKNNLVNIIDIVTNLKVPVFVKEVGFGLSKEVAIELMANGVNNFDVGGYGGTNFIAIENKRNNNKYSGYIEEWGIPTVCSLVEVASLGVPGKLIATGGIRNPIDAAKAIVLGADLVGMAGILIKIIKEGSETNLMEFIEGFTTDLKKIVLMCGARNIKELKKKPAVITGYCREWLNERGINTNQIAQR